MCTASTVTWSTARKAHPNPSRSFQGQRPRLVGGGDAGEGDDVGRFAPRHVAGFDFAPDRVPGVDHLRFESLVDPVA